LEGSRRDSPCSRDYDRYKYDERSVIPALFPPEGAAQISGGWGARFAFGREPRPPTNRHVPRGARGALLGAARGGGVVAGGWRQGGADRLERLDVRGRR
jgi:hypothetical protein